MIYGIRGMAVSGVARVASTVKRGVTISSRNTPMENPALTSTWSVAHRNICWKSRVVHWSVTVSDISLMMLLPTLATKIGLNEAMFLQQLHYWIDRSKSFALIKNHVTRNEL